MDYTVYILYSSGTGEFYKGQTNNLISRIKRHNAGYEPSGKNGPPDHFTPISVDRVNAFVS